MSISVFDNSAFSYDEEFTFSAIGKLQRKRVYNCLLPLLKPGDKLLEVNCGTGHDAMTLSSKVETVYATDISGRMIEVAEKKLSRSDVKNVTFNCVDARELHKTLPGKFNFVLSNFGGLNCLNRQELSDFSRNIAPCLHSGSLVALVLMGKKCWMENLWYFLRKDSRRNRRDTTEGLPTTINGSTFNTYYFSPREMGQIFNAHYTVKMVRPVGFFIPPSYLNALFSKRKWLLGCLNFLELMAGRFSFLSNYSDHFLIVLEKR